MSVPKGTTPTVICVFNKPDLDLTLANNVYVTFTSNLRTVTKSGEDLTVEPNRIIVRLSQADTLSFQIDDVEIQANWTYDGRQRACSTIEKIDVTRNLLMREVD